MTDKASAYGPNSGMIRRFLQRLAALPEQSEIAAVTGYLVLKANRRFKSAELELGVLVARTGRERERDALAGPLLLLVRSKQESNPADSLRPIAEPALAALLALLMYDVLSPADFTALYEPFAIAIPFDALA